jgi:hypothetical protein
MPIILQDTTRRVKRFLRESHAIAGEKPLPPDARNIGSTETVMGNTQYIHELRETIAQRLSAHVPQTCPLIPAAVPATSWSPSRVCFGPYRPVAEEALVARTFIYHGARDTVVQVLCICAGTTPGQSHVYLYRVHTRRVYYGLYALSRY